MSSSPTSQAANASFLSAPATPPASSTEEAGAIRRTLSGEREAFREVVELHQEWLYRYLHRMVGGREEAEDLVQETFLRAYRSLSSYKQEREFRPWLFRIAANVARSSKRRPAPAALSLDDTENPIDPPNPADPRRALEKRDHLRRIHAAVALLSDDDRELFHLRYGEGLGPREIAPLLARTEGAVSAALYRMKDKLRKALENADAHKEGSGS